jgi:glyoxylase-like metal-dependent hydrolase (beta-lactamase superfamily II)
MARAHHRQRRHAVDLIKERGEQDKASEIGRFPRLFRNVESVPPGLTWPTLTFTGKMTLWLGKLEVQLLQLGRGHTKGDTVVWLPQERILFSGDLVEFDATPYAGDAYFSDWPQTLDNIAALKPEKLVPGRGAALQTEARWPPGLAGTRELHRRRLRQREGRRAAGKDLKTVYRDTMAAVLPEVRPLGHLRPLHALRRDARLRRGHAHRDPRIWTAERDIEMWKALES